MGETRVSGRTRHLVILLDKAIRWIAKHWLMLFNLTFGIYAGLPVLAPLLMSWGQVRLANVIYFAYQFACHQMPSRSFFIGRFQMAICQRDFALYGGACVAGLVFAFVRNRIGPLPVPVWVILIAPLVIDGSTQVLGLRLSTWQLRTVTALLASGSTVWLVYPYLEEGFRDIRISAGSQLSKAEKMKERHP